jgi:hypothetical protein
MRSLEHQYLKTLGDIDLDQTTFEADHGTAIQFGEHGCDSVRERCEVYRLKNKLHGDAHNHAFYFFAP